MPGTSISLDAAIDLSKLKLGLKLAEIYDGLQFPERPGLVDDGR